MKIEPVRRLLEKLGNPHNDYSIVHVAGTKGKGSVTRLIAAALDQTGYRTGAYTSPHLNSFNERITIGGLDISDPLLTEVLDRLFQILDENADNEWAPRLTFFDLATAAGFLAFSLAKREVAVVEVGLGGRLDSTNVCQSLVAVITNVSLDHQRQLGNTVAEIAGEKAGIIKPKVPVFSAALDPAAIAVLEQTASAQHAPLYLLERDFTARNPNQHDSGSRFDWQAMGGLAVEYPDSSDLPDLQIQLAGRHQIDNAALSVAVLQHLRHRGFDRLSDVTIRDACRNFQHAGRIEQVSREPTIILDVAHNVASTRALIETLTSRSDWSQFRKRALIFAVSNDKDREGILRTLLPHFHQIVFTRFLNNPRATAPDELLGLARSLAAEQGMTPHLETAISPDDAWQQLASQLEPTDLCCVAGSLFLISELRPQLTRPLLPQSN